MREKFVAGDDRHNHSKDTQEEDSLMNPARQVYVRKESQDDGDNI